MKNGNFNDLSQMKEEMNFRHANTAKFVQSKIIQKLKSMNVNDLSPSDLIKWFEISVKVERQALEDNIREDF